MSSKKLIERCPFRPNSASAKIFLTVARSSAPIDADEVCRKTKLPEKKVKNLLNSYAHNPMHDAPLRKAGVRIVGKDGKYSVASCAPQPHAKRPPRGDGGKRKSGKKAKSAPKIKAKAKGKPKAKRAKKQPTPKPDAAPVPVPAQEPAAGSADTVSQAE